ncbi:hypothetical protein ACEXQD_05805 [Herbiconiux sp. P15]|uniref:hypothetical protein n=1 Tax=Herbiconiux liukaitaii TaxID=3342799 RepID=UPI0035B916BE
MKTLDRAALAALALAALLTASGCAGSTPEPTATVTVTAEAPTPSPSASPTSEPDPEPDPAAYSADDPGTWVIDYAGIGPLVVGSTLSEVQESLQIEPETCRAGVDTYVFGALGFTAVSGIDESDPAAPIAVVRMLTTGEGDPTEAQPLTEAGIGIGDTVADLQATYQELTAEQGMGGSTYYQLAADGRTINFEDMGTGVIQIISVSSSVGVASEYCGA